MIQDIWPKVYDISFKKDEASKDDYLLIYKENQVLLSRADNLVPYAKEFKVKSTYLFSIDGQLFYLAEDADICENEKYRYYTIDEIKQLEPMWIAFVAITGLSLKHFYDNNRFCGHCGARMEKSTFERAMCCTQCKNVMYPKISPAVIVAVTNGDELLMTKYANRPYSKYALVAGFVETGETLEDTVRREVMEEVGLRVKDIKYYKSQPWSFSDSLLMGFFASLDGDSTIHLDTNELKEGRWFKRADIPYNPSNISLTNEMIELFRNE